jgi:hypothetical protein
MFIKVVRNDLEDGTSIEMIIPFARIKAVYAGYEGRGSRLLIIGGRDEIHVEEDVDDIWRMIKDWQQ